MAVLYFFEKALSFRSASADTGSALTYEDAIIDSTRGHYLADYGIVTLDDLYLSEDSKRLKEQYCEIIDNEVLKVRNIKLSKDSAFINWIVQKYFGRGLASKNQIFVDTSENNLNIHLYLDDSEDYYMKFIQIDLSEIRQGQLDNNDILDFVIPFYTLWWERSSLSSFVRN